MIRVAVGIGFFLLALGLLIAALVVGPDETTTTVTQVQTVTGPGSTVVEEFPVTVTVTEEFPVTVTDTVYVPKDLPETR